MKELTELDRLKLSCKYSISEKHQKDLVKRIAVMEHKDKPVEIVKVLENQIMWDVGKKYVEKQEINNA